jgi:hypothetical protein
VTSLPPQTRTSFTADEVDGLLADGRVVLDGGEGVGEGRAAATTGGPPPLDPHLPLQSQQTLVVTIPTPPNYFDAGTIPIDKLHDDGVILVR